MEWRQATDDEYQQMNPIHQAWYDMGIGLPLYLLDTGEIESGKMCGGSSTVSVPHNGIARLAKRYVPGYAWTWCGLSWRIDDNHCVQQVPTTAIAAGAMAA